MLPRSASKFRMFLFYYRLSGALMQNSILWQVEVNSLIRPNRCIVTIENLSRFGVC
ncbi:hypothetical protein ABIE33_005730 [Ensifer sp. 4252]